ncbi:MAG: hypothetical protein DWQ02_19900 [Bacteroidetes bacterium]|nr:MAG: hypothetical protein DWQ02_19900 [Bacteroidota bacterium]
MRIFCLFLFLVCAAPALLGQNYYVAVIKGKVYYENKLLKKRDKIKMKGMLKFTSAQDFIKVSGPGGLYRLDPEMAIKNGSEFFVAIKEELFPRIRPMSTSEQGNIVVTLDNHYFNQRGYSTTFLDRTYLSIPPPEIGIDEEFGFLHETKKGLIYKTASITDKMLAVQEKDFSKALKANLKKTAIVLVRDKSRWLELISNKDSIAQIINSVDHYSWDQPNAVSVPTLIRTETGETIEVKPEEPLPHPAQILDYMGPPTFVDRKKMAKDLRFHLKLCKAPDIETFLIDYEYEDYIFETYGYLRDYPDINMILREDLKLTSQHDGLADPVIIEPLDDSN